MLFCVVVCCSVLFFFFKQKTAYEMRISDWSSDVCSSDLTRLIGVILPRLTDLVVATIYEGIDAGAKDKQYITFVGITLDLPERQIQLCEAALAQHVKGDRNSVVSGKRVSVRVDLGGRRTLKKTTHTPHHPPPPHPP